MRKSGVFAFYSCALLFASDSLITRPFCHSAIFFFLVLSSLLISPTRITHRSFVVLTAIEVRAPFFFRLVFECQPTISLFFFLGERLETDRMPSEPSNRCCPTDATAANCVYHPTGEDFYISGPLDSKAGIVIVSDIFGMLPNSKRIADVFAKEGYLAIMPDFFGSKAWDYRKWPPDFEGEEWKTFLAFASDFARHRPRVDHAIQVLRKLGVQKVGIVGMCWGAVLAFQAAADGTVNAVATAHPSFFTPATVKSAKTPVLVMPSQDEPPFDDVEAAVNAHPVEPHVYKRFDKIPHGYFGARYDPDTYTPEQMEEVEEARHMTLDFFKKTLH